MFPKINSAKCRNAWEARKGDLLSFERSSEVFMRGIRAPPRNLSGKRWNPLCSTRWEFNWASPLPSSSEKPIHLARGRFLELEHRCETAQLARDAAQLGRAFGRLGRRSEEHTSELQSLRHLVCRLLLE